jgi:hypothetical protein
MIEYFTVMTEITVLKVWQSYEKESLRIPSTWLRYRLLFLLNTA